jgi:hypothetical protein
VPYRFEEDEPDGHPGEQGERRLDDPVAQLAQVIHEGHAALGILPPLRAHVPLTDDTSTLDGAREFRHDRFPQ